jgi:hypothetical protein
MKYKSGLFFMVLWVSVAAGASTVYFDLGAAYIVSGNWNTVADYGAGLQVENAIDSTGTPTSVAFNCVDGFAQANSAGESGVTAYPVEAGQDSFYLSALDISSDNHAKILIGGLTPGESYDVKFFGSRASSGPRALDITIGSETRYLDAARNISTVVAINGVQPDAGGGLAIDVVVAANSTYGYLGVIEINGQFGTPLDQEPPGIYVAPWGYDSNSGTYNWPLATLQGAVNWVRSYKQSNPLPAGGLEVYFREGVYNVSSTVNLSAADSGTAASPIVYMACPKEEVIFTGGQVIDPAWFESVTDNAVLSRVIDPAARSNLLQVDLGANGITEYGQLQRHGFNTTSGTPPMELYIDGQAMTLARYPNEGDSYLSMDSVIDPGPSGSTSATPGGTFSYTFSRPSDWTQASDIWLAGAISRDWAYTYNKIASIDTAAQEISLVYGEQYGITDWMDDFFWVENLLEEIDTPGEYYIDRSSGILYLLPPAGGLNPQTFIVVSSLDQTMVNMNGADDITFKGLTFDTGRSSGIVCTSGEDNSLEDCTIRNFSGNGLTIDGFNNTVKDCNMHHIGKNAVTLKGGDKTTLSDGNNLIENSYIYDFAYYEKGYSSGVSLDGVRQTIRKCLIYDAPHGAVTIRGNDHMIEYNEFHHVVKLLKDYGVIYAYLGQKPQERGTTIRQNYFHDIYGEKRTGIYPDESTCGWTVEKNIFYKFDVNSPNIDLARGTIGGNTFNYVLANNNMFIDCGVTFDQSFHLASWAADKLPELETIWASASATYGFNDPASPHRIRYPELEYFDSEDRVWADTSTFQKNFVWNPTVTKVHSGAFRTRNGESYSGDPDTLIQASDNWIASSDPGFVDAANGDFSLTPGGLSALQSNIPGFVEIQFDQIGPEEAGLFGTGDINKDGSVDMLDFARVASKWFDNGCCCADRWCLGADIDRSGDVSLNDTAELFQQWMD